MCGIAGVISPNPAVVAPALAAMVAAQTHRGPDDSGAEIFAAGSLTLGLGQHRLSIIDLSPLGHQPMIHPESGDALVFNGEIYNFQPLRKELENRGVRFRGHSDTEVLLHLLALDGPDCLQRLAGMFALAFYEKRRQRLILARDPLGIKPLYTARTPGIGEQLLFASEVRAVVASGLIKNEPDRRAIAGVLAYGAPQAPLTVVRGVEMFPAGCWQSFDLSGNTLRPGPPGSVQRYWRFPPPKPTTEQQVLPQIEHAMEESVREHLIADVPVGVFLSSGLDSTIIAGLAARHTRDLRTFTVGFADEPDMSEAGLAGETAKLLGSRHTTIDLQGGDALALVQRWLTDLDQPSMDGLNVYVISRAVRAAGVTVILSGQGGDELFGGYPSFVDVPRAWRMMNKLRWMPAGARRLTASMIAGRRSSAVREKLIDMFGSNGGLLSLALQRRRAMSNAQLAALGLRARELDLTDDFMPAAAVEGVEVNNDDPVWTVSEIESLFYQGNTLLRDSDANSMCHSLELRVPFLDKRVVDLASSIPGAVRLPRGVADKHLLRRAFAAHLRPALLQQNKKGFRLPINRWMLGPLRGKTEAALARLRGSGLVDPAGVDRIWQAFLAAPESPIWSRAWTLCVLGSYLERASS